MPHGESRKTKMSSLVAGYEPTASQVKHQSIITSFRGEPTHSFTHTHTHRQPKAVHFQEMEYLFQPKQTGPQLQVEKAMLLSAMEAKIHGLRDNIST